MRMQAAIGIRRLLGGPGIEDSRPGVGESGRTASGGNEAGNSPDLRAADNVAAVDARPCGYLHVRIG